MVSQYFDIKKTVFCFTGKSPKPRHEMEKIAIIAGAKVTKSINNKTTILVIADANSTSSKAKKARDIGVYMISPSQFFKICKDTEPFSSNTRIVDEKPRPITQPNEKRKHSSVRRIQL